MFRNRRVTFRKTNLRTIMPIILAAYNFACCFVWLWNLVAYIEGGMLAKDVWELGVEENICA